MGYTYSADVDSYFGRFLTLPGVRELSVAEQRDRAVLEVISERRTVTEVACQRGPASVEASVLDLRRERPYWGPRQITAAGKIIRSSSLGVGRGALELVAHELVVALHPRVVVGAVPVGVSR